MKAMHNMHFRVFPVFTIIDAFDHPALGYSTAIFPENAGNADAGSSEVVAYQSDAQC